jgi:hypothetical protein
MKQISDDTWALLFYGAVFLTALAGIAITIIFY